MFYLPHGVELFDNNTLAGKQWESIDSKFKHPLNLESRKNVINFLCGVDNDDNITIIYTIFWNLFIPITLAIVCLIYYIWKRNWYIALIILGIIARIPLVFLTAPAPFFMYYLSTYLCLYIIIATTIFKIILKLKHRPNKRGA